MTYSELQDVLLDDGVPKPDSTLVIEELRDGVCGVGLVGGAGALFPMRLEATSSLFPRAEVVPIIEEDGTPLGDVLTCAGTPYTIGSFSAEYLAAYLSEATVSTYGTDGKFQSDYFLVRPGQLAVYEQEYMSTSAIWGGFEHVMNVPSRVVPVSNEPRIAVRGIHYVADVYSETAMRSVPQPFAFERYLKLYHLFELSFDYEIVESIRNLGGDLRGIGQLMSSYSSKELDRLRQVIGRCRNPSKVVDCIKSICSDTRWHDLMQKIFFDFGKEGNPVPVVSFEGFMEAIRNTGYTLQAIQPYGQSIPKVGGQQAFEKFSLNLAAYWIYRVRSSIAHSRIGEYVMRAEDEQFVAFFAEPLLRTVLTTSL